MSGTRSYEQAVRLSKISEGAFFFFVYGGFILFCLMIIYPVYYVLINSINGELIYGPALYWPGRANISNYVMVFKDKNIVWSLTLSVIRVTVGVSLAIFVNSMCAFALRRRALKFRNFYLAYFLIPMFFQGGLIPVYLNLKMLGLLDTFSVFIFPTLFTFYYVIILMTCFSDISQSVEDSAKMDGAGYFTIYARIYMPMSVPVIVTICLFVGVMHWQTWFDSLYFTRKPRLQTFAAFLMKVVTKARGVETDGYLEDEDTLLQMANAAGIRYAAMVLAVVPVLMIYPFIQKYFVKGIRLGSVKG